MPRPGFDERLRAADAALRTGRARTAEQALRALSAEAPADLNCQWLLGIALLDLGRPADSVAILEAVLRAAPSFANARVDLARAYRAAGRAG
ncbi:MAG: tetratricopeptide repeat protein, partial [Steroidobacteraceae bacterium]